MKLTKKEDRQLQTLRETIRETIEEQERTFASMAKRMRMSAPYFSQIMNGSRRLSAAHLCRLTRILNVTLEVG
jgi:transcriptional regulator with XRE-family HTH domain